jgi:hypothetical protein
MKTSLLVLGKGSRPLSNEANGFRSLFRALQKCHIFHLFKGGPMTLISRVLTLNISAHLVVAAAPSRIDE